MRHLRSARHRRLIEEIVRARTEAGLSQRALAALLKRSPSYVSKFEAGERRLEVCEFVDLCIAIKADPLELLGRVLRR
jgi:transcriptional regulator with XRE-family HTH domain